MRASNRFALLAALVAISVFGAAYAQQCTRPPENPALESCLEIAENDYIEGMRYCRINYGDLSANPNATSYQQCVESVESLLISDRQYCYYAYP